MIALWKTYAEKLKTSWRLHV